MATVNPGTAGAVNMAALQLAELQYGNVPVYDASLVRIDNGGGRFTDFRGAFTYASGGGYDPYGYGMGGGSYYPSGGTVSRITEATSAGTTLEVDGLAIDAPMLFSLAEARNFDALLNSVFGGNDALNGSALDDWLDGYGGADLINPGAGSDSVRGLDGDDTINGGAGQDDVNGNRGVDLVHGDDGADTVRGGQGADTVYGDLGDDPHVNGNIGDDVVFGGAGADTVFGGQNDDRLFGEDGADLLSGDLGSDTLSGGAGADRFLIRAGGGADLVSDFNPGEGDRIQLEAGQTFTVVAQGGNSVVELGGGTQITVTSTAPGDWVVVG